MKTSFAGWRLILTATMLFFYSAALLADWQTSDQPSGKLTSSSVRSMNKTELPAYPDPNIEKKIKSMQPLFEGAINGIFSLGKDWNNNYQANDLNFMWTILFHYASSHGHLHPLAKESNGKLRIPKKVMQEFAASLFADYSDLLPLPENLEAVSYNLDYDSYDVQLSDAGAMVFNISDITPLPAGKYQVKIVVLDDMEETIYGRSIIILAPNPYAKMIAQPLYYFSIENIMFE